MFAQKKVWDYQLRLPAGILLHAVDMELCDSHFDFFWNEELNDTFAIYLGLSADPEDGVFGDRVGMVEVHAQGLLLEGNGHVVRQAHGDVAFAKAPGALGKDLAVADDRDMHFGKGGGLIEIIRAPMAAGQRELV